jgi:hypothetical protein
MKLFSLAPGARTRARLSLGTISVVVALAACGGDGATSPAGTTPALRKEIVDPAVTASVLLRSRPLTKDMRAIIPVGPAGASFFVPNSGLRITVPPNAVSAPIWLTVTAKRGNLVAYEFGPHGTVFNVPIVITQDLSNTLWRGHEASFEAGYFAGAEQLDAVAGKALINEFLPVQLDAAAQRVSVEVKHFSGYVIATGRTRE